MFLLTKVLILRKICTDWNKRTLK